MSVQLKAIGGSLMVIIPSEIVREAGLQKGQQVDFRVKDGKVQFAPSAKPDWASFFAMDFGIPADFMLEREPLEDRDVFGLGAAK